MAADLDPIDWQLLTLLQEDARLGYRELGRRIAMSPPAVATRVRRLESLGVITGYSARVDPAKAGLPVQAFLVVTTPGRGQSLQTARIARENPLVVEDHRITGTEDHLLRVLAPEISALEPLIDALNEHGKPATSFVLSSPKAWTPIPPPPRRAGFSGGSGAGEPPAPAA